MIGYALGALVAALAAAVVAWRVERSGHRRTRDRAVRAESDARVAARTRDAALADMRADRAAAAAVAAAVETHSETALRVVAEGEALRREAAVAAARIDAAARADDPDDAAAALNAAEGL